MISNFHISLTSWIYKKQFYLLHFFHFTLPFSSFLCLAPIKDGVIVDSLHVTRKQICLKFARYSTFSNEILRPFNCSWALIGISVCFIERILNNFAHTSNFKLQGQNLFNRKIWRTHLKTVILNGITYSSLLRPSKILDVIANKKLKTFHLGL
jgi:hypothetical protein